MATQAAVRLNPVVQGADMKARTVTFSVNAGSPTLQYATFMLANGFSAECVVSGAAATLPFVSCEITAGWSAGDIEWTLSTTIAGVTTKWLIGSLPVLPG